jgi:MFS family permease
MRLVTYSWLAVVLAVACAAIGWLGLAGWLAAAVLLASVAMHMAGNAIGTRLREATDLDLSQRQDAVMPVQIAILPATRPTPLERRSSLGRLLPVSVGIGGLCGGLAGTVALLWLTDCSPAGAMLGGTSSAVIGGLFGFLAASFVEIVRASLRESLAAERAVLPSAGTTPPPTQPRT